MVLHKAWYCSVLHLHGVAQSLVLQYTALHGALHCMVLPRQSMVHGVAQSMILHAVYCICMLLTNAWYCSILHCMVHCIERCCTKHGIAVYCMALHGVDQSMVLQCTAWHLHGVDQSMALQCTAFALHGVDQSMALQCTVFALHGVDQSMALQCAALCCVLVSLHSQRGVMTGWEAKTGPM